MYYPSSIAGSSFIDKVVFKCLMDIGHKGIRTMFTYMLKKRRKYVNMLEAVYVSVMFVSYLPNNLNKFIIFILFIIRSSSPQSSTYSTSSLSTSASSTTVSTSLSSGSTR